MEIKGLATALIFWLILNNFLPLLRFADNDADTAQQCRYALHHHGVCCTHYTCYVPLYAEMMYHSAARLYCSYILHEVNVGCDMLFHIVWQGIFL